MAANTSTTDINQTRQLAQACWSRCKHHRNQIARRLQLIQGTVGRDSTSSFKLLTSSVRQLRNKLEEVEEIYDNYRTLGPNDLQLLNNVHRAHETLQQLDRALQNHQRHADVRESDVADFKTSLDVLAHELSSAVESIDTSGDISPQILRDGPTFSPPHGVSTSSTTGESALGRQSSHASSSWSSPQRDSASFADTSSEVDDNADSAITEKDLRDTSKVLLSPNLELGRAKKPAFDWLSPFASPDPLSMSIEAAAELITSPQDEPDEDLPLSVVRSRSGTGSTIAQRQRSETQEDETRQPPESGHDARATSQVETDIDRKPLSEPSDASSLTPVLTPSTEAEPEISAASLESSSQDESRTSSSLADANASSLRLDEAREAEPVASASPTAADDDVQATPKLETTDNPVTAIAQNTTCAPSHPRRLSETSFLSPASAAIPRTRTNRVQSLSSLRQSADETINARAASSSAQFDAVQRSLERFNNQLRSYSQRNDTETPESKPASAEQNYDTPSTMSPEESFAPNFERPSTPTSVSREAETIPSPPPPTRKPPPPPVPRSKKSKKPDVRRSSYRIVNASPADESSSEDELYAVSPQTSPKKLPTMISIPPGIPEVKVADHDLELSLSPAPQSAASEQNLFRPAREMRSAEASPSIVTPHSPQAPNVQVSTVTPVLEQLSPGLGISIPAKSSENEPPALPARPPRYRGSVGRYKNSRHIAALAMTTSKTSPTTSPLTASEPIERSIPTPLASNEPSTTSPLQKQAASEMALEIPEKMKPEHGLGIDSATRRQTQIKLVPNRTEPANPPELPARSPVVPPEESQPAVTEWYGPGADSTGGTSFSDLELERIRHIVHFWNGQKWDKAEEYLADYLSTLIGENSLAKARRVRHLLGVAASLRGNWDRSIPHFLATLRRPINNITELDDGDCAAAYWLGDAYALQNKRTEALLSYCIAERSSLFRDAQLSELGALIALEQETIQLGASKNDFKLIWSQQAMNNWPSATPETIMDTNVITTTAAKMFFDNEPRRYRNSLQYPQTAEPFRLDGNTPRSGSLFSLSKIMMASEFKRMNLTATHFQPDTPWPMMYDPTYCIANVARGRLLTYECDLINVFTTNSVAKTRFARGNVSQVNCFTANDIFWIIRTIRECLTLYGMEWSEVANVEGTWFMVRYSPSLLELVEDIAPVHYFAISLFKQTLRGGYGVDICPDGICSSRITSPSLNYERGVNVTEPKRIKKLIREFLDEAAKQQKPRFGRKASSNSSFQDPISPEGVAPPVPPRPSRSPAPR